MKGFLRQFLNTYSGVIDRHRMLWILSILMCFGVLYLPRYTQESDVRQKILDTGWSGEGLVTREIEVSSGRFLYSFTGMELYSPQELVVGSRYAVVATVVPDEKPTSIVRLKAKTIQERPTRGYQELIGGYFRTIDRLQTRMQHRVFQAFYPDTAQLVLGFAIGKKPDAKSPLSSLLQDTGLIHVAVASGANIAVMSALFHAAIKHFTPKRVSIILTLVWVFSYAILTGFDPSILRAFWMFVIVLAATWVGRPVQGIQALLYSVMIGLIYQPFLVYSLSFQLSIAATIGILCIHPLWFSSPSVEPNGIVKKVQSLLIDYATITLSSSICVAPLLLVAKGSFNLGGILANTVVGWILEPLQFLSLVYAMGFLSSRGNPFLFLEIPLWALSQLCLGVLLAIKSSIQLPIQTENISGFILAWYYGILVLGYLFLLAQRSRKR